MANRDTREDGQAQVHSDIRGETLASAGLEHGAAASTETIFERGDLIGRYMVLEEVGRGSMGVVLAAYDPELDRKVALKLLRLYGNAAKLEASRGRMLREAKAMASLAHPNVIAVHDVGAVGDAVFIAMEYVESGSLRQWLAEPIMPRSWQSIVQTYIQAGEGLAAAHDRGIIHRDFKPDNALVHPDGRVGVADFGLARLDERAQATAQPLIPGAPALTELRSTLGDSSTDESLTHTGALLGTPAYMAPEQHLRAEVDERSDQFAFCVSLWEALAGERPFAGRSPNALAVKVIAGEFQPFPRDSPVPAPIRAALERGLSAQPEERFPSMRALLGALTKGVEESSTGRRWATLGMGLAALALILGGLTVTQFQQRSVAIERPSLCSGAELRMTEVWDAEARADVEARFAESELAFAASSFERAAGTLDALREQWVDGHTRACQASRVYGEQSEDMLDRRMTCLSQRRGEIAAVSAALREGDPDILESVDKLLATIDPIEICDDLALLEAEGAPPTAAQRGSVELLRWRLADLEVRRRTILSSESLALAADLVRDAEAAGYDPVLAEALRIQAHLLDLNLGPSDALPVAQRSMAIAARSSHRRAMVRALSLVAWIEGGGRSNFEFGLWLLTQAEAELVALGQPPRETLRVMSDRAGLQHAMGDFGGALAQFELCLAFAETHFGPNHLRAADLRFNIAAMQQLIGRRREAETAYREALKVYSELMGPEHPEVAQIHSNLSVVLTQLDKTQEARVHAQLAIAIWETSGGGTRLAGAYGNLAFVARAEREHKEALGLFSKAHALKVEIFGADHIQTLGSLGNIADSLRHLERYDEAGERYAEALRLSVDQPQDHPALLDLHMGVIELAMSRGDYDEALRLITILEPKLIARDPNDSYTAGIALFSATVQVERGYEDEAIATLRRGLERYEAEVNDPIRLGSEALLAELTEGKPAPAPTEPAPREPG